MLTQSSSTSGLVDRNEMLQQVIRPIKKCKQLIDVRIDSIQFHLDQFDRDESLELIPDFQRGHVWTVQQQISYVENLLRGVVADTGRIIQFNSPTWSDDLNPDIGDDLTPVIQCVDGLQRLTALLGWVNGSIKPFGFSLEELKGTRYSPKQFFVKFGITNFKKRHDLLQYYLDLNTGGTVHSETEIERVRGLLKCVQ